MNNEWITDRLPTRFDGDELGHVWVTDSDGTVRHRLWESVKADMPWKHLTRPKPYVKPKRYTVKWLNDMNCWAIMRAHFIATRLIQLDCECQEHREAAERMAAIYEEVLP